VGPQRSQVEIKQMNDSREVALATYALLVLLIVVGPVYILLGGETEAAYTLMMIRCDPLRRMIEKYVESWRWADVCGAGNVDVLTASSTWRPRCWAWCGGRRSSRS
jgi:hypothetical protein